MIDLPALLEGKKAFLARRIGIDTMTLKAAQIEEADGTVDFTVPDRYAMVPVKRNIEEKTASFDPVTGKKTVKVTMKVVESEEKQYDPAKGHHHGGHVRVKRGDYVVLEDGVVLGFNQSDFARLFSRV